MTEERTCTCSIHVPTQSPPTVPCLSFPFRLLARRLKSSRRAPRHRARRSPILIRACSRLLQVMSSKRVGDGTQTSSGSKRRRLRAADVVLTTPSMATSVSAGGDGPPAIPVRCTIAPYGLSGPHASRHFPETGRVWQVQVEHPAKPSLTYGILKNWLEYKNGLRRAAGKEEAPTLEGLERESGIRMVLTGAEDEHGSVTTACRRPPPPHPTVARPTHAVASTDVRGCQVRLPAMAVRPVRA